MNPLNFILSMILALKEGDEIFAEGLVNKILPLKNKSPLEYYNALLEYIVAWGWQDIYDNIKFEPYEDWEKIIIPDNWDWDTIEKLLSKEED